jgi:hypothetical protein
LNGDKERERKGKKEKIAPTTLKKFRGRQNKIIKVAEGGRGKGELVEGRVRSRGIENRIVKRE